MTSYIYNYTDSKVATTTAADSYVVDNSVEASLKPRLVISNDREHRVVQRFERLEHAIDVNRQTEALDRDALIDDVSVVASSLKHVCDYEDETQHTIHLLSNNIKSVEQERIREMHGITGAILRNKETVDSLIKDVAALSMTQRAELILQQVTDTARAVGKAAEITSDGIGIVPVFGASIANGSRVIAHTAEFAANTADAIKASGILKHLDEAYRAISVIHERPLDIISVAVATAHDSTDLITKLQHSYEHAKHEINAGFSKVSVKDAIKFSSAIIFGDDLTYLPNVIYNLHPTAGGLGLQVWLHGNKVGYALRKQFGDELDEYGYGLTVLTSGDMPRHPGDGKAKSFILRVTLDSALAMVKAFAVNSEHMSVHDIVGHLEQFFCLSMTPDDDIIMEAYNLHKHDQIMLDNTFRDDIRSDLITHNEGKLVHQKKHHKEKFGDNKFDAHSTSHIEQLVHTSSLQCLARISSYSIFEYALANQIYEGKKNVFLVVDQYVDSPWYVQVIGFKGQTIYKFNENGTPISTPLVFKINNIGIINGDSDSALIRVYVKKAKHVRIIVGWDKTTNVTRNPIKETHEYEHGIGASEYFCRHIVPNDNPTLGRHTWSEYADGNYTVTK